MAVGKVAGNMFLALEDRQLTTKDTKASNGFPPSTSVSFLVKSGSRRDENCSRGQAAFTRPSWERIQSSAPEVEE